MLQKHRIYPLSPQLIELLRKVKAKQDEYRSFFGKEYIETQHVFTWENGKPISCDYLSQGFSRLRKKYNLPKIRLHDLRHTCASILLSDGMELKDVQEWLGHANISMTADVYGHLDINRKKEIGSTMSNLVKI